MITGVGHTACSMKDLLRSPIGQCYWKPAVAIGNYNLGPNELASRSCDVVALLGDNSTINERFCE